MNSAVPADKATGKPSEGLHEAENFEEIDAFDGVSGAKLDPRRVRTARRDEI